MIANRVGCTWNCWQCTKVNWRLVSNRKQSVVLNGCLSEWRDVISEVLQGSVLGPLLFIIYSNDIDDCVVGKILTFPDDTKIYHTVHSDEYMPCSLTVW